MQQRASRARQSDDEQRPPDLFVRDGRVTRAVGLERQAGREEPDEIAARGDPPDAREPSLTRDRPEQESERLTKSLVAEIRRPRRAARSTEEIGLAQGRDLDAGALEGGGDTIHDAHHRPERRDHAVSQSRGSRALLWDFGPTAIRHDITR